MTAEGMRVRVWVTDVWDAVELPVTPDQTIAQVKSAGLERATERQVDPGGYTVKFRGAEVLDENESLEALGIPDGAPLIIVPVHRRPVR